MKLMVDKDAIAHNTSIPVPIHWREEVKPDLTRMFALVFCNLCLSGNPSYGATE